MNEIKLSHCVPFLPTADIHTTIEFYQNKLAFEDVWKWDDPPTVIRVGRGPVKFLFSLEPDHPVLEQGFDIMIFLNGIGHLYEEYQNKEVEFYSMLEKKPWGIWEFSVYDNNGYLLRFGEER